MGDVVELNSNRAGWLTGPAICLGCRHEWTNVSRGGDVTLLCPSCGTYKGVPKGLVYPKEVWECVCGNDMFFLTRSGAVCARCGSQPDNDEWIE